MMNITLIICLVLCILNAIMNLAVVHRMNELEQFIGHVAEQRIMSDFVQMCNPTKEEREQFKKGFFKAINAEREDTEKEDESN